MTEFELLESYYGERGYRHYVVYNNNKPYAFKIEGNRSIYYLDDSIYINGTEATLENIIFSIKMYYYKTLKEQELLPEDFIIKFNKYQQNVNDLHEQLIKVYKTNERLEKEIDEEITKLFKKKLDEIVYKKDICDNELGVNTLRPFDIMKPNICFEDILLDLYECELHKINKNFINITINTGDLISINEERSIVYLTNHDIISRVYISDILMASIQKLYTEKIYQYIHSNHNETLLHGLYECLDIKYIKLIVDDDNYKLLWILEKMHIKHNLLIPYEYIPKNLLNLVENNYINNHNVVIKYNTDSSDLVQMNTYLIDKLHCDMHNAIIYI